MRLLLSMILKVACTRARLSALWILALAEPLFGYPVRADGPEVEILIAPHP